MKRYFKSTYLSTAFFFLLLISVLFWVGCNNYICKDSAKIFQNRNSKFTVTVYPVNVVKGNDTDSDLNLARSLAAFLQKENLATPVLCLKPHSYNYRWGHDQSGMAKRSAVAFMEQVKRDSIDTDYALLVEILINWSETKVHGIHYYLVTKEGLAADGGLNNSHWSEYKAVMPKDREDGLQVAEAMLINHWGKQATSETGM